MKRMLAKVVVFGGWILFAVACSSDSSTSPNGSIRPGSAAGERRAYPLSPGFRETSRFTTHGKKLANGSCMLEDSERLARGQRSSLRVVEFDPGTCEFVVGKGQRVGPSNTSRSIQHGMGGLTRVTITPPPWERRPIPNPRYMIQCGDPGADPSCDPGGGGGGGGGGCDPSLSCDVGGGDNGSGIQGGLSFQDAWVMDPAGIQVNEDLNRVSFTWDTHTRCILNASVFHGYYWFGQSGWVNEYLDGYKFPISCGSAGGDTAAYYSNARFCTAITGGFGGPTYVKYTLNRVSVTPYGYTDFYLAAGISGDWSNLLHFEVDRVS